MSKQNRGWPSNKQQQLEHGIGALKFKEPNLAMLDKYTISKEVTNLLKEYIDIELMDDELIAAWSNEIAGDDEVTNNM